MWRRTALVGALTLLLLMHCSTLAGAALTNAGMLPLRDALIAQVDLPPGTYPVYEALDETPATARAMQILRCAVARDEGSPTAQWALGRAALALGDVKAAAGALRPPAGRARHNPLLYHDALTAFSYGGKPAEVIALYEAVPPPERTSAMSGTVALAYLGRGAGGRGALERASALRPGDLYANYCLWRAAVEAGDVKATAAYSETLAYFPLEAIDPTDERLLGYTADAIPNLLEDGLWGREKTLNVVSFLAWQHHEVPGVERLLGQLTERYATEPDWPFFLGELYQRQGDLDQAEATYCQVLTVAPAYAQAYLRLGMVSEAANQRVSK